MRVAWWCLCGLIWPIERRRQGRVNKRRKGDGIEEALFREARSTRNWLETDHIHIIICMNRSREVQPMRHFLQFQASSVQMGYASHGTARLLKVIWSTVERSVHRCGRCIVSCLSKPNSIASVLIRHCNGLLQKEGKIASNVLGHPPHIWTFHICDKRSYLTTYRVTLHWKICS